MYQLNPGAVTKFTRSITNLQVFIPEIRLEKNRMVYYFTVEAREFYQQILPEEFEPTKVWGFGGLCDNGQGQYTGFRTSMPGPSFFVPRNTQVKIKWNNKLTGQYMFPVDPTLVWANPDRLKRSGEYKPYPYGEYKMQAPVPISMHIHGAQVPPIYDGHPDAWFTANNLRGPMFLTDSYKIWNSQEPSTLWYHDNTRGMARLNLYSGLSGAYIIFDFGNPGLSREIEDVTLILQDKSFYEDGSLYYPLEGEDTSIHPYWVPEFFGNVLLVNGVSWPYMEVEKTLYRFRFINGSNCRSYEVNLSNGSSFLFIATDGGCVETPLSISSFKISPGERVEILMDFSRYETGEEFYLKNTAVDALPGSTDTIMQFRISSTKKSKKIKIPYKLNHIEKLVPDGKGSLTTINSGEQEAVYLDGQAVFNPADYFNRVGETVIWDFLNLTDKEQGIHLHLIQFQIIHRQAVDKNAYSKQWEEINGSPPLEQPVQYLDITSYLQDQPVPPETYERGWKDTVSLPSGHVTRIIVRYAPVDTVQVKPGENKFPFDPSVGEYVINVSMAEAEDNEGVRAQYIIGSW